MSSVNLVTLIGRLGQNPDLKTLDGGNTVCNFSLATSDKWTNKSGQKQEKTTWHRITAWGKLAEICGKYLTKGSLCYVEGKISERQYDKDGETRSVTEIIINNMQMLDSKPQTSEPKSSDDEIPW